MSTGGTFQLLVNTGIQDKMLMATERLTSNIKRITTRNLRNISAQHPNMTKEELKALETDWMPLLRDIERTHILFITSSYKPFVAMTHEYSKTMPKFGRAALGEKFVFALPIIGEFVNDAVVHIKLDHFSSVNAVDKVRFVEFIGHRLIKRATFRIKEHIFDEYTADDYNAFYQFKIKQHKEIGYLRNIGQEIPKLGYLSADPTVDEVREYRWFGDGTQTFKQRQSMLELWIPLLFWFKDIQCSLPNFILPTEQTKIEIEFEKEHNLIAFSDYGGGGAYNVPVVTECQLYLNHLFLLPSVMRIFTSRYSLQLIRIHREHRELLKHSSGNVHLSSLKWPVECLYIQFRPVVNKSKSQQWYRGTEITETQVKEAVVLGSTTIQVNSAVFMTEHDCITSMGLKAFSNIIYPELPPSFYNSYIPMRYGTHTKTPKNLGWYMMNFNFDPGNQQPSGHFNISRSRELYLQYTSATDALNRDIIREDNPVELIVLSECINFILFTGGNAILRFAT